MEDLLLEMFYEHIPLNPPDFYLLLFSILAGAVNVLISVM